MAGPSLYTVFEYLATLVAERDPGEPFLLSQIQPAIRYKFPEFSLADYQLPGLKDFILAGDKAGYFKLVNTGNAQTAYLAPGTKTATIPPKLSTQEMGADDPRRTRWMNTALEEMLSAERADQIIDAVKDVPALTPEFDAFLAAQGKDSHIYHVRGKIKRLRDFLATCREKGEAQAMASWQTSRAVLRMPTIPQIRDAAAAQSLIWTILQGTKTLDQLPIESLDNLFFGVLAFSREQMLANKSWDWVVGLNILESEARAVPRPAPPQQKRGLFGGKQQPVTPSYELDEAEIVSIAEQLRQASGIGQAASRDTSAWQAFVDTPSLDTTYRYLAEHPNFVEDEDLLTWLDDQISQNVAAGKIDAVKNLANKSAMILAARQFGLQQLRQQATELRQIYESVMDGARLLSILFGFVESPNIQAAAAYFQQHSELTDESIGAILEDQIVKAVHQGDVARYKQLSERMDLWRNLLDFGPEQGIQQHEGFLNSGRDDKHIQAEMGLTLLIEATTPDERQDVIGRYPSVATDEGLRIANHMVEMLSFHNADPEEYNRYYNVKRLIERCLQLGVDRALAELK